jgi:hypothetical protein
MACLVQWFRSPLPRAAAFTLMTIGVGACSGDTSRFNDNPFSSRSPEATASLPPGAAGPAGRVETYPLPQQAAASPGVAGGGRGLASYTPNAGPVRVASAEMPEVTGGISAPKPVAAPSGHWNWNGGTPITVAPGETIDTIARRYGVPAPAIMKANNRHSFVPGSNS